jgi:hypothetical protein
MTFTSRDTLLTLNTRTGVKKKPVSYSSYWMDFDDMPDDDTKNSSGILMPSISETERSMKLASVRRAIANFVRILTNDDTIKVTFSSGKQSYTDGKKVVISADDDAAKFDSMVGLALHEGSHCLLSDFGFLANVMPSKSYMTAYGAMNDTLRSSIPYLGDTHQYIYDNRFIATVNAYQRVLSLIMNVIEDRRIDSFVYTNAAGYRPYYDAMYQRYFLNKDVNNNLLYNPDWRKPSVENYINWLINVFNRHFDRTALPGLGAMVDMIDLRNIRRFDFKTPMKPPMEWTFATKQNVAPNDKAFNSLHGPIYAHDTLPLLWQTANNILAMIIQYVTHEEMKNQNNDGGGTGTMSIDIDGTTVPINSDGELENLDMGSSSAPLPDRKFNEAKAKKAMEAMKKVMRGDIRRKKLTASKRNEIDQLESASAELVESGDKIIGEFPCLVTRKMNRSVLKADWFPFAHVGYDYRDKTETMCRSEHNEKAVVAGFRMGQILAHRLQVRNDPQITHFTRQPHGRVDRRILAQLGMDIEQVFKRTTIENFKPAMLHLSLDASGSMGGQKWERTIAVATALAYVSSKVRNIQTVISLRGSQDIPIVSVIYDSRTDNFQKARTLFPYLNPAGSTPEGLCFKATMNLITECAGEYDVYFINFSDGEPGCSVHRRNTWNSYNGDTAAEHTKRQVQMMREVGVKILSYFISEYNTTDSISAKVFRKMYGENAAFVNVKNSTEVIRTLNNLLLKKGA